MKNQIMLLLGLILIGALGLAAGIEASKGNWDYRLLLSSQESTTDDQMLVMTTNPTESSALPF